MKKKRAEYLLEAIERLMCVALLGWLNTDTQA